MTASPEQSRFSVEEQDFLRGLIARHHGRPGALLSILEAVQERHPRKYLPPDVLEYIAAATGVPPARIWSVVTFYALFNQEPQGENTICICRGTACHTRGSRKLLERLKLELGLSGGNGNEADKLSLTTADGKYTLRTVACFGQCALAPVAEINHVIYGHMNEQSLERDLEALQKRGKK